MRRPISFIALSLLVIAGPKHTARGQEPAPTFRANIDLVSLTVTVVDKRNNLVRNLEQDDFNVFEDGIKQRVEFFSRRQTPIAVAVLLDTSASMEERLPIAQKAASGFIETLRSEDQAEIIDFDSRVNVAQGFTNDRQLLERAIRQTTADGPTSLHNAIYIALKELRKVRAISSDEIRRQSIVLLSDGEDTSSLVPFEEVLELAKRSDVAIYSIGLRSQDVAQQRGFNEADFVLRQFAQETGGKAFFPNSAAQLPEIYAQIASELSSQYLIGYASNNSRRDGQWRRVVVQVDRPDALARTKQGYYGPTQ
jgi:Ca-activated chloride channel family protein